MTTSATTLSVMTVSQVVQAAMEELGLISAGEEPGAEDLQLAMRSLNWMLKTWAAADGINMWRDAEATVIFAAGTPTMPLAPRCLDVSEVRTTLASGYGSGPTFILDSLPGEPDVYIVEG